MSPARRPPKEISRQESLASRPVRNEALRVERRPDQTVLLHVTVRPAAWARVLSRLFRLQDVQRRISLDELGTCVWDMCDGQTTVRTMIDRFARRFKLNRKEAEVSMVQYLRTLAKKGLIGIIVPESPKERKGGEAPHA